MWALQVDQREQIFARDRDFMADTRNNPWGLVVNPALSLVAIRSSGATAASPNGHNVYYDAAACDRFGYTTVTTAARGTYCGSFTQPSSRSIFILCA